MIFNYRTKIFNSPAFLSLAWLLPSLLSLLPYNSILLKALLSAYYLFVPGLLVAMLLSNAKHGKPKPIFFVQAVGLSVAFLMFVGYFANILLPVFSIAKPLDRGPFLIIFNLALYVLAFCARDNINIKDIFGHIKLIRIPTVLNRKNATITVLGGLFLIMSIFGTIVLNNGGPNYLTVAAILLLACSTFYCIYFNDQVSTFSQLAYIYCVSLGLLLMYSLRSSHIMGFDINQEYHVFQLAQLNGKWTLTRYLNPYNACLSITVLPALLSNLIHISGEYVFKFLYQAIFALVPVALYLLYVKLSSKMIAIIGVFIFIFQLYFVQQLPALARQEIAFLFFVLILHCILLPTAKRLTTALLFIFSFALIVSHYSTAYFWMFTLIAFYALHAILKLALGKKIDIPNRPSLIYPLVFILGIVLWFGQLAPTSSNLTQFITKLPSSFSTILTADSLGNSVTKLQLQSSNVNTQENLNNVFQKTSQGADFKSLEPIDTAKDYEPQLSFSPTFDNIVKGPLARIGSAAGLAIYIALAYGLEAIGMIVVFLKRSSYKKMLLLEILSLACVPLVALIVLVPAIAVDYNLSRAYMQLLILFSPFAAVALTWIYSFFKLKRTPIITAALLSVFLLYSSGINAAIFGGQAYVTLGNFGYDYDKFYTTDSEVRAADWLVGNYSSNTPVYTDKYGGLLLQARTGITRYRGELFANVIDKNSYVYLRTANLKRAVAFTTFGNQEIEYTVPLDVLMNAQNTVYTSGDTNILR